MDNQDRYTYAIQEVRKPLIAERDTALARAERAEAQVRLLRDALRPFAEAFAGSILTYDRILSAQAAYNMTKIIHA